MVFGVPDPQAADGVRRKQLDKEHVGQLFGYLGVNAEVVTQIIRVGRKPTAGGVKRPIRVTLSSDNHVHALIKHARNLGGSNDYKDISLSFDRTPRQLAAYRAAREQLRVRQGNGEANLRVKYVSGTPRIVTLNR